MKKIYSFLVLLMITSFVFGQNLLTNGGFESWTSGLPDNWTSESGTTLTQDMVIVSEGTSSVKCDVITAEQGMTDFRQAVNVVAGTTYNVSVDIYHGDSNARARIYADGYQNYSDETIVGNWQTLTFEYNATNSADVEFGLRFYDAVDPFVNAIIYVDNFIVEEAGSTTVTQVANIEELRAGAVGGGIYELTGEAFVTMMQTYRNQKWIQDATAAILIDDVPGIITSAYNFYDGMTGLTGSLTEFNGVLQFVPLQDPGAPTSSGNAVTIQTVTWQEFNATPDMYESELIMIESISTDATGNWESGTNYTFYGPTDIPEDMGNVRTNFFDADYIGTPLPTEQVDMVGIAGEFNGLSQLYPRDSNDIQTLSVTDVSGQTKVLVYASSSDLLIQGTEVQNVKIFNANGKLVVKGNSNQINIAKLPKGTYFIQIESVNGKVQTTKFLK